MKLGSFHDSPLFSAYVTITCSLIPVLCFCRCMFSMWIFVTKTCRDNLCGVFHHVDSQNNYATPSVFLTSSGRIPSPCFSLDVPETFLRRPGAFTLDPSSLFTTRPGQLHVQVRGKSDESSAFLSSFTVPLNVWCHISLMLHGGRVRRHLVTQHPLSIQRHLMGVHMKWLLYSTTGVSPCSLGE